MNTPRGGSVTSDRSRGDHFFTQEVNPRVTLPFANHVNFAFRYFVFLGENRVGFCTMPNLTHLCRDEFRGGPLTVLRKVIVEIVPLRTKWEMIRTTARRIVANKMTNNLSGWNRTVSERVRKA